MTWTEPVCLKRDCDAIGIPGGVARVLPAGTSVRVMQFLGSSYTVTSPLGMYRIDVKDADAMGLTPAAPPPVERVEDTFSEKLVWDQLKTVYDPEIPINIADLGLIYSCAVTPLNSSGYKIDIKMSMTAPGCGMGNVLKADVEDKLLRVPEVREVNVEIVFDPPWNIDRMSEAARLQLGFDL
jgi:probable FeS assembly SUF system protein SufT